MFTLIIILMVVFSTYKFTVMLNKYKVKSDIEFILDVIEGNNIYISRKRNKLGFGRQILKEGDLSYNDKCNNRSTRSGEDSIYDEGNY